MTTPARIGIALALGLASAALADGANPRRDAYVQSADQLDALVVRARDGRMDPERLRRERRRLESRLDRALSDMPVDLKPGDLREVSQARAEMNQSVIRSQEYEFFGPDDRPEWGWYPSRRIPSTGSTLTVQKDGRTSYNALR
ncbi:MAG: hypothetical protein ACOYMI_04705 [Phycisphaerales bacterium]|jgi:hypothetical protein